MLKTWTSRLFPKWRGHHVPYRAVLGAGSSRVLLPWGFLGAAAVQDKVVPRIQALTAKPNAASSPLSPHLPPREQQAASFYQSTVLGDHRTNEDARELFQAMQDDMAEGAKQAYAAVVHTFLSPNGDFLRNDFCSPDLAAFLEDVKKSYEDWGVMPLLNIEHVEARLRSLRFEQGYLSKNTYALFGGTMGKQEAVEHFLSGVVGPEAQLLQEMDGDVPRRLVAEVELTVQESFAFMDPVTKAVVPWPPSAPAGEEEGNADVQNVQERVHYFSMESDYLSNGELEWIVCNINDVIRSPSLSYVHL